MKIMFAISKAANLNRLVSTRRSTVLSLPLQLVFPASYISLPVLGLHEGKFVTKIILGNETEPGACTIKLITSVIYIFS